MLQLLTLAMAVTTFADAQETSDADEDTQRLKFMTQSVAGYEVQTDSTTPVVLHPEPVLRWNNPVSGVKDGIISMWTLDGRPVILAQVFQARTGTWLHEFQSVAETPMTIRDDTEAIWTPTTPGVEMHELSGAPQPAPTQVRRLVQMRQLAQRFTAVSIFRVNPTDVERSPYDLRLMSRPLYRYGDPETDLTDGALFAFAQGTNPEVWLLLEVRQTDDGPAWHYGMAPMTGYAVSAKLDGEVVLETAEQPSARFRSPESCYFCIPVDGE